VPYSYAAVKKWRVIIVVEFVSAIPSHAFFSHTTTIYFLILVSLFLYIFKYYDQEGNYIPDEERLFMFSI
jgi:hypothetical protein